MIQSQSKVPDIFISYASDDRERVVPLAKALENRGWTVWWDRRIPPGKTFDEVIKEGLTKSKCVIVVWSEVSVESRWVKTEASIALKRNKLVPVMIDQVEPPLEFLMIQAANLVQWQPGIDSEEFQLLVAAVEAIAGEPRASDEKAEAAAAQIESAETGDRPAETTVAGSKDEESVETFGPTAPTPVTPPKPQKRKTILILAGVAVCVLVVVAIHFWPAEEPGVYMLTDASAGDKLETTMVRIVPPEDDQQLNQPLNFEQHLRGACLFRDISKGHLLQWSDLKLCR